MSNDTSLLEALRTIERDVGPIFQLVSRPSTAAGINKVSSLQVQSLISLLDRDSSKWSSVAKGDGDDSDDDDSPEEKEEIEETCKYLIHILHQIYQNTEEMKPDFDAVHALQKALSTRLRVLPKEKLHNIDGCENILHPPDTSKQVLPSTIVKEVQDTLKIFKIVRDAMPPGLGAPKLSLEEIRQQTNTKSMNKFLVGMFDDYTFEECIEAFLPHDESTTVDDYIDKFVNVWNEDVNSKLTCLFAGVLRALHDQKYGGKTVDKDYVDPEPKMYHGWTGSWREENHEPSLNDVFYGVKLGAILEHAQDQAEKILADADGLGSGTAFSSPRAKFHQDMSSMDVKPKGENSHIDANDITICRATHSYIDGETFMGDDESAYSNMQWSHDGTIGFSHTGSGWKNREFFGHVYSFDRVNSNEDNERGFVSTEIGHQFWNTPSQHICDSTNNTVWIRGDQRIKGYSVNPDTGKFYTSFIFNVLNKPKPPQQSVPTNKRQKMEQNDAEHGDMNLLLLGDRIAYLDEFYLQEWKLSPENRHDGTVRMCHMNSVEEDLAAWPEDDILNLSQNTWMDDTGKAEVTRGKTPDSAKLVNIVTPYSVGYLRNNTLAMANRNSAVIQVRDYELREMSGLVGLGLNIEIVQRPTFEGAGDLNTFVASDSTCVKIFDLRSGKAEMTIKQHCVFSTPVYCSDAKFVLNQLYRGQGAMMWDLRVAKPLYSLPISAGKMIAWVPTSKPNKPPILMTSSGETYEFGMDLRAEWENNYEKRAAKEAWSKLEQAGSQRGAEDPESDCCIV